MKKILLLIVAIVASLSAWAQTHTVVNVVARHARIAQYSTLYVGEVVADGQSFYYMYSEDITNSTTVLGAAKDCLADFKGGVYSALMPSIVGDTDEKGLAVCSNSDYESLMNSNWTNAANAAQACLPNATVTSSSSVNLFETDPDFAAKCLSVFLNEYDEADLLDQNGETLEVSSVLGKLSATNTDNVTYTVVDGQLVKLIDRTVDYTCESITVIYTKAELETGKPGDTNGDGKVNVTDVTALVNMILGVIPKDEARADINGDGKVNVSDVTALVNIILGV